MERIGKYDIRRPVGRGGMAEVFEAEMQGPAGFKKPVCIKRIRKEYAAHPQFRAAFESEARIAATLHHPNVVEIYDFDQADDQLYLVMEYVDGVDLQTILKETRGLGLNIPVGFAIHVMQGLLAALDHAHTQTINGVSTPIIHRDVSPQNILVARDGTIKLTDFGIAKAKGLSATTMPGTVKGKLAYLSPEQAEGRSITPTTDLFSAGTLFYEMLTGQRLFAGESASEIVIKIRDFTFAPIPFMSQDINRFLSLLLAFSPSKRFSSAAQAVDILNRIASPYATASSAGQIVEGMLMRRLGHTALMPRQSAALNGIDERGAPTQTMAPPAPIPTEPRFHRVSAPRPSRFRIRPAMAFLCLSIAVGLVFLTLAVERIVFSGDDFSSAPKHLAPAAVPLETSIDIDNHNRDANRRTESSASISSPTPNVETPPLTIVDTASKIQPDATLPPSAPASRPMPPKKLGKKQSQATALNNSRNQKPQTPPPPKKAEESNLTDIERLKQRRVSFER